MGIAIPNVIKWCGMTALGCGAVFLCSCEGRTMENMVPKGETVEVVISPNPMVDNSPNPYSENQQNNEGNQNGSQSELNNK